MFRRSEKLVHGNQTLCDYCRMKDSDTSFCKLCNGDPQEIEGLINFINLLPNRINLRVDMARILLRVLLKIPKVVRNRAISDTIRTLGSWEDINNLVEGPPGTQMKYFKDFNEFGSPDTITMGPSMYIKKPIEMYPLINLIVDNVYKKRNITGYLLNLLSFFKDLAETIEFAVGMGCIVTDASSGVSRIESCFNLMGEISEPRMSGRGI